MRRSCRIHELMIPRKNRTTTVGVEKIEMFPYVVFFNFGGRFLMTPTFLELHYLAEGSIWK